MSEFLALLQIPQFIIPILILIAFLHHKLRAKNKSPLLESEEKPFVSGVGCFVLVVIFLGALYVLSPRLWPKVYTWQDVLRAAESGDSEAQYAACSKYFGNNGTAKNYEQAALWCKQAALQQDVLAQYILGSMYLEGKGFSQSDKDAFYWFRRAAENGDSGAQSSLALMYESGRGVAQSYKDAFIWFTISEMELRSTHPDKRTKLTEDLKNKLSKEDLIKVSQDIESLSKTINANRNQHNVRSFEERNWMNPKEP